MVASASKLCLRFASCGDNARPTDVGTGRNQGRKNAVSTTSALAPSRGGYRTVFATRLKRELSLSPGSSYGDLLSVGG